MFCSDAKKPRVPGGDKSQTVGTIREASKLGGLDIKEWLQSRKGDPSRNRLDQEDAETY